VKAEFQMDPEAKKKKKKKKDPVSKFLPIF